MKNSRKKIAIGLFGFFGLSMITQSTHAQFAGLPFSNMLANFPQYSSTYYHFGGNNFVGMIFLSGSTAIPDGEKIYLSGSTNYITCYYKINGVYYNNLRGWRIWPLDTGNLNTLTSYDTNYSSLTMGGGFYTNCSGFNAKANEIYGQVTHSWGGINYNVTAGLAMNTGTNSLVQSALFSGSLSINSGKINGLLYDTYGGIGELGEIQIQSSTGTNITVGVNQGSITAKCGGFHVNAVSGTDVTFSCTGTNVNGYILNLFESSGGKLVLSTGGYISPYSQILTINTGDYIASCTVNIGNDTCNPIAISNLSGEIFSSELGSGQIISTISMVNKISPIRDANVNKTYRSEKILVAGLVAPTLATINKGSLIINGTGESSTGYVKNGDILEIELISSKYYNTTTSSQLFIGGMFGTFSVITKDDSGDSCEMNKTQKLKIAQMFELLKDSYSASTNKWVNMLYVLQSMTEDIKEFDYSCSLDYLTDLVENEIEDTNNLDITDHTAPNCKIYPIKYDDTLGAYTSTKFKKKQYFSSRDTLVKFIDSQNPGDCHINIYTNEEFNFEDSETKHAAPNGKIYTIEVDTEGYYSSPTMMNSKKFDTLDALTEYIDKYNPEFQIRDHEIEKDWTPIIYAAPNNKEYKIYKTDQGFMSYKFLTVRYFTSLQEIKSFIDKNNK